MKKIIHFQIPTNEKGTSLLSVKIVGEFCGYLKRTLPKYYVPIFTPCKVDIKGNKVIFDTTELKNKVSKEALEYIKSKIEKEGYLVEIIK